MVPVRALVYSRVSTDAQERDGTLLGTQERACVEYAESQRMVVVERIRDTASPSIFPPYRINDRLWDVCTNPSTAS